MKQIKFLYLSFNHGFTYVTEEYCNFSKTNQVGFQNQLQRIEACACVGVAVPGLVSLVE